MVIPFVLGNDAYSSLKESGMNAGLGQEHDWAESMVT
jgi:hypothetical protein